MSFTSTLYLCPVLDLLLVSVPPEWQAEIRLGLQEALVNAAKHGNKLDPSKTIIVRFSVTRSEYSWIIADEGSGFPKNKSLNSDITPHNEAYSEGWSKISPSQMLPTDESENGRGFSILHEIFDGVHWNRDGTQLTLSKAVVDAKEKEPSIC